MHLYYISQNSTQNMNVLISVLNCVSWDIGQVHSGICETGPSKFNGILTNERVKVVDMLLFDYCHWQVFEEYIHKSKVLPGNRFIQWVNQELVSCKREEHAKQNMASGIEKNSSMLTHPPSAVYLRQWIRSAMIQIIACRLFGAKPLSKPMLGHY